MSSPAIHFIFLLTLSAVSTVVVAAVATPTAYQVLEQYNFPVGLLPQGVTGYELDASTGRFAAYLNGSCRFTISDYDLKYKSTITGVISNGRLRSLKGITVNLLLWVNIGEVTRRADKLEFSVSIASAKFDVHSFEESPQCGCGFKCLTAERNRGVVVASS